MNHVEAELQQHIDRHETLLWVAQPEKGIRFRPTDFFLIPFSLFWCGFSIFWMIMASKASLIFALFGVPFVLIGLMLVFGRFIFDAKLRANTYYGLTAQRIIIKSGIFKKTIKTLIISSLSEVTYDENNNGTGTISIGPSDPRLKMMRGMSWYPGVKANTGLEYIENVRSVYNHIIELQQQQSGTSPNIKSL